MCNIWCTYNTIITTKEYTWILDTVQDFLNQIGHQTTPAYTENKHFFTKPCHRRTYQNYEQPPQSLQNLYFQSHFSASKSTESF